MDRRKFIQQTGIITAGSLMLPSFLRADFLSDSFKLKGKRVVIIQLSGGNDGLNTVVPHGLDAYYNNRPNLGIATKNLLEIDEKFGLHSALKALHRLHKEGDLAILNAVGYPNPNRSHFRSMDIWHTASGSHEYKQTGWLGRYLDSNCKNAYEGIEINGNLSLAMKGKEKAGIALTNPSAFYKTIDSPFYNSLESPASKNQELQFMYKMFHDTKSSAQYIFDQYRLKQNTSDYPSTPFANQLKMIATLMKSNIATPIFYTSLGGFDTHVHQQNAQERLLTDLDGGLGAFVKDLRKDQLMKETTILIFSEFGRRLKENASRGTDHGAANALFIIDTDLTNTAFQYNDIDLEDLEKGDQYQIDFRRIYQELLTDRLKADSMLILDQKFKPLSLFN